MLELLGLALLVPVALVVAGIVLLIGGLLHVLLRLLVLPFALLGLALKAVILIPLGLVALLVLGPAIAAIGLVLVLPLALFGLLVWGVVRLAAA